MKATSLRRLLVGGLALGLVACGADATPGPTDTTGGDTIADTVADTNTTDTNTTDTAADTNTTDTRPDVTLQDTATNDTNTNDTNTNDTNTNDTTANDTTTPTCSRNGFLNGTAYFEHDEEFGYTTFGLENDNSFIAVEFYDFGNGSPLDGPGNYQLGANADDRNYETCETCLLIYTDCTTEDCAKVFFGTGGTIEVSAINLDAGTVTATLRNIVAVEVTIDEDSFRSTPVANGETYCITSVGIAP